MRVEIADTGMGIEPEALPKIFDAFEQGGRTQLGGLGLGLAISKTLVEAHKGTITAQSAGRNKGSKFALVFPTCEKVEAQIAPALSPRFAERQPMRILLVEDHEDTNRSLTSLLRRRGYHVQSALTFQSALELSAKEEFDVLISDLGLPDGSGIDLIQKLASKTASRNRSHRFRDGTGYPQKPRGRFPASPGKTNRPEQAGFLHPRKRRIVVERVNYIT